MPTILSMSVAPTVARCNTMIKVSVEAAFDSTRGGTINVMFSGASHCVFEPVPVLSARLYGMHRRKTFKSSFAGITSGNPRIDAQIVDAASGYADGTSRFIATRDCP